MASDAPLTKWTTRMMTASSRWARSPAMGLDELPQLLNVLRGE